jgi:hypothetical protein
MDRACRLAKNLLFLGLRRLRTGIAQMSVGGALDLVFITRQLHQAKAPPMF